ncbi:MAG: alpha/beta fold hydrolase [Chloroflexi bacterium]|nr:alpha/beta fold hydrolase [Chloroflexota bacterium]
MKHTAYSLIALLVGLLLILPQVATPSAPVRAETSDPFTAVLRRGYLGYDGMADTFVMNGDATPNGAEQQLDLKEVDAWGARRILLRFTLPDSIPSSAQVNSAVLTLFPYYMSTSAPITLNCYYLLKPWTEAGATWNSTGTTESWLVAGAGAADEDYEASWFASATVTGVGKAVSIDLHAAVARWLHAPSQNHGILIKASTPNAQVNFRSAEVGRADEMPALTIGYTVPEATETPTASPSPTASQTPLPSATPPPGATLTFTPTPPAGATPTTPLGPSPTPVSVVYSFGPTEAALQATDKDDLQCVQVAPGEIASLEVVLVWEGQPSYARLRIRHSNNSYLHTVLVNGHEVGRLPVTNYAPGCSGGVEATFDLDPAILISGVNTVSIRGDDPRDANWSMQAPRIELGGTLYVPRVSLQNFTGSDEQPHRVIVQQPATYLPGAAVPLVIACHGRGGRDFDAFAWNGLAEAANQRGWILACPDLRSDPAKQVIYTPSIGIQRDVDNLIAYLHGLYSIDASRIYIMGMSQGGMFAATLAAKAPDVFAALAEVKGPTSLTTWYGEVSLYYKSVLEAELGGPPNANTLFSYQRRSVVEMTPNLRNLPVLIVHGLNDTIVPYHHAVDLKDSLDALDPPSTYEAELYSFSGGHDDDHPEWTTAHILDWFSAYTLNSNPDTITVRTDEAKAYYWLELSYVNSWDPARWTNVRAVRDPLSHAVVIDVSDERQKPIHLTVNLLKAGLPTEFSYVLEDTNLGTGEYVQTVAAPQGGKVTVSLSGDPHHLALYPLQGVQPELQTVTVSQVEDTYIDTYNQSGYHDTLPLWVSGAGTRSALLRFALGLPENAVVKGAQLRLYASYKDSTTVYLNTTLHGLNRAWLPEQANWQQWRSGQPWTLAGALGADSDYVSQPSASAQLTNTNRWYTYNLTQLVQQWVAMPESNNGVLLRGGAGSPGLAKYRINSSEDGSNHPELLIHWAEATPTPTPTATPTATPRPLHRVHLPAIRRGPY